MLPRRGRRRGPSRRRPRQQGLLRGGGRRRTARSPGVSYEELKAKFGKDVEKLPLGAVGIYTASQKTRRDLISLTEECEKITGIPYVMRAYRKEAEKILAQ